MEKVHISLKYRMFVWKIARNEYTNNSNASTL